MTRSRSIAEQSLEQLGGPTSILARQCADHARLARLMAQARNTEQDGGTAHAVTLRAIARLVFTHAFAEEAVLFPSARRALPEGDPLTLHIEEDHQAVNDMVAVLDASSAADPGHSELLERTFAVLDDDVRTEEDELLPRLQQVLSPSRLRLLGWQWEPWSSCRSSDAESGPRPVAERSRRNSPATCSAPVSMPGPRGSAS